MENIPLEPLMKEIPAESLTYTKRNVSIQHETAERYFYASNSSGTDTITTTNKYFRLKKIIISVGNVSSAAALQQVYLRLVLYPIGGSSSNRNFRVIGGSSIVIEFDDSDENIFINGLNIQYTFFNYQGNNVPGYYYVEGVSYNIAAN